MPKEKDVLKVISKQLTKIQGDISQQGKQIESLDKKVGSLDKKVDSLDKKVDSLESDMLKGFSMLASESDMHKGFSMLASQISGNEKRLIAGIEQTQVLFEDMKTKFETVSEGNIDHDRRLSDHEKRINKLENQI